MRPKSDGIVSYEWDEEEEDIFVLYYNWDVYGDTDPGDGDPIQKEYWRASLSKDITWWEGQPEEEGGE